MKLPARALEGGHGSSTVWQVSAQSPSRNGGPQHPTSRYAHLGEIFWHVALSCFLPRTCCCNRCTACLTLPRLYHIWTYDPYSCSMLSYSTPRLLTCRRRRLPQARERRALPLLRCNLLYQTAAARISRIILISTRMTSTPPMATTHLEASSVSIRYVPVAVAMCPCFLSASIFLSCAASLD
jgi:hypothetical protein